MKKINLLLAGACILAVTSCTKNKTPSSSSSSSLDGTSTITSSATTSDATSLISIESALNVSSNTSSSEEPSSKYKVKSLTNLSSDFFGVSCASLRKEVKAGDEVIIKLTAGPNLGGSFREDSKHLEHVYINVNGVNYKTSLPDGTSFAKTVNISIPMPEEDIDIVACYSVQQHVVEDGHSISLVENNDVKMYGVDSKEKYDYINCYLVTESNYKIDKIEVKFGNNDWQELTTVGPLSGFTLLKNGLYDIVIRPMEDDVQVRVSGKTVVNKSITYPSLDEDYLDIDNSILPKTSEVGKSVTIKPYAKYGCYIKSITVSGVGTFNSSSATFTMPNDNITVTFEIAQSLQININPGSHIEHSHD